jgi:hypothetical protein
LTKNIQTSKKNKKSVTCQKNGWNLINQQKTLNKSL